MSRRLPIPTSPSVRPARSTPVACARWDALESYALHLAQIGAKHEDAKPLKGFGGAGVLEIVSDHVGDTYRAVYTVKFATAIYVLHAFQKKSKTGSKTPVTDLELIARRLKVAQADYKAQLAKGKRS